MNANKISANNNCSSPLRIITGVVVVAFLLLFPRFVESPYAEYAEPVELLSQLGAVVDGLQLNWLREPESFDLRERWCAIADPLFAAAKRSTTA